MEVRDNDRCWAVRGSAVTELPLLFDPNNEAIVQAGNELIGTMDLALMS